MTHFDVTFDYLEILDLEPAQVARLGIEGLRDHIQKKKKEWTAREINPLYQQESRANKERILQFEELLKESRTLATYVKYLHDLRDEKRQKQVEDIGRLVAFASGERKEINLRQKEFLKKEAQLRRIPEAVLETAIENLGIAVRGGPTMPSVKPLLPHLTPALDRAVLGDINNWLKVLGIPSLYALLELPQNSPPARLISTAKILYAKWSKILPKTSICTAWEKTLQACLTFLKDNEGKARYDRGLFNQRIDQFVKQIDLILAGTQVGRKEQSMLTRLGVQDFGFDEKLAADCILARAAQKGVAIVQPAAITIQLRNQVQCQCCFFWSDLGIHKKCRNCGTSLSRQCENPSCRHVLPSDAKVCAYCRLPFSKGRQYVALLELADRYLERGSTRPADEACEVARQILSGTEVDHRLARSHKIRLLVSSIRVASSQKAWTKAAEEIRQLLELAPRLRQPGIPKLEIITDYMAAALKRLSGLPTELDPATAAKPYLVCLTQWTDAEEIYEKLRSLGQVLEGQQRHRTAWQLARKLQEIRPGNKQLSAWTEQLEQKLKLAETIKEQIQKGHQAFASAVQDHRLYDAEKALQLLEQLDANAPLPAAKEEVRQKLAEIRTEIVLLQEQSQNSLKHHLVLKRYLAILADCRDCREALAAVQEATLDPPAAPSNLTVQWNGPRRCLSWETGAEFWPIRSLVERSLTRLGATEGPFKTIYEGPALHYIDEESIHCGTVIRYIVHAIARICFEVRGETLRECEVVSKPTVADPVLFWQEVLNLRGGRLPGGLQLTWHQPAGVSQVVIKRWLGSPDDSPITPVSLPFNGADSSFLDTEVENNQVYTYRVSCEYDGPRGTFTTPGVLWKDGLRGSLPLGNGTQ